MSRINPDFRKPPLPENATPAAKRERKRQRLRQMSAERAGINREVNPQRRTNRENVETCQVCGQRPVEHSHEISAGSAREIALDDALCQLQLCAVCHPEVQYWKPAKQIACLLKWLAKEICLNYCEYKQLAPTAVEPDDVILYISMSTFEIKHVPRKVKQHGKEKGSGRKGSSKNS